MGSRWIPKTLEEVESLPRDVLTCQDVSGVLGMNPYSIHRQATDSPGMLGFPVIVVGTRVKIPKGPFLRFMKGGTDEVNP